MSIISKLFSSFTVTSHTIRYNATICQILRIKSNIIFTEFHLINHLFASLGWFWNWFLIWPRKWKKRRKKKMEVIRTSALKLVYPRGGSTCPLKISKRTTIEYRERDWRRERDFVRARVPFRTTIRWQLDNSRLYDHAYNFVTTTLTIDVIITRNTRYIRVQKNLIRSRYLNCLLVRKRKW